MKIDKKISDVIMLSRFPLAVLVVFIHSVGDINGSYYHLRDFISHPLLSFVVPAFFIISGYLFFMNVEGRTISKWYRDKIKKRAKTLLLPYVIWNLITLTLDFLKYVRHSICWINYGDTSLWGVINKSFFDYMPIDLPLWYIRDLIILVVISPALYYLLKKVTYLFVVVIGIWYFIGGNFIINPVSLLFFSLGGLLAIRNFNLLLFNTRWQILLAVSFTFVLSVLMFFDCWTKIPKAYAIIMPFVFFNLMNYCSSNISMKEIGGTLSKYSDIIYYSHYPITLIAAIALVSKIFPNYSLVNYFIIPLLAVMFSVGMKVVFDKIKKQLL